MFFQILDNSYGPTNQWPLFFMLFFVLLFIWFIWILVFMFFSIFFPVLSHLDSGVHFVLIVLFIFFFMWISVFISFIAFTCSCRQPFSFFCLSPVFLVSFFHLYVHAVRHVHFSFGFFSMCVSCSLCPSVALCCLMFVSCLCLRSLKLFLLQKVPQHFSKTFWLRSKASIANEQDTCHEATWKSRWKSI